MTSRNTSLLPTQAKMHALLSQLFTSIITLDDPESTRLMATMQKLIDARTPPPTPTPTERTNQCPS